MAHTWEAETTEGRILAQFGLHNMYFVSQKNKTLASLFGVIFPIQFLFIMMKSSNNWRFCGDNTTHLNVINIYRLEG